MTPELINQLATRLHTISNTLNGVKASSWDKLDGPDTSRLSNCADEARAMGTLLDSLVREATTTEAPRVLVISAST